MIVAVGSENPVKINAVKHAFKLVWPGKIWEVTGIKVPSGVSEQPMSDAECIRGAINRAKRAQKALKADFGVGIEGGVNKIGKYWFDCGWMVVINKKGVKGIASSARMETAPAIMKLAKMGMEIGDADDKIFKAENSKQKGGHFSLMTDGLVNRKEGYIHGVIFALTRFIHPELW